MWLVIGPPDDRQVSEERKKELEKKKETDSYLAKLIQEVLKLREENDE
jgi:hypothetical protein